MRVELVLLHRYIKQSLAELSQDGPMAILRGALLLNEDEQLSLVYLLQGLAVHERLHGLNGFLVS